MMMCTHPHGVLYVTLKTTIPNICSPAPHYQHTSHPLTYGMTLWPWQDCWHSGTMPWGLPGAVRDPGWRNGDRDGLNTHTYTHDDDDDDDACSALRQVRDD